MTLIGKTLASYIAWRFVKSLVAMMLLLFFLIVTVDFIENLRRTDGLDVSMGKVYMASVYTAPWFIEKAFPFACLFSAIATLYQLNQKLELVVARAAGISAWQFMMPIAGTSIVIGLFAAMIYNPLAISMYQTSLDTKAEMFGENLRASDKRAGYWLRQTDENGGSSVIHSELVRDEGKLLTNVRVFRFDSQDRLLTRIEAASAEYKGDHWHLLDVARTNNDQRVEKLQTLDIPTRISEEYLLGSSGNPEEISFWELKNAARSAAQSGLNALPFIVKYYSLIALPALLVAMSMIAATVSLRFARFGGAGKMILGGIVGGFVLYAVTQFVTSLGSNGMVPPLLAAWSPAFVAILIGMSIILHQEDG